MLLAVTRVQTLTGTRGLTSASGFFFRCNGRLFLATSRHVFFDAATGHAPDHVQVTCHTDALMMLTRSPAISVPA